MSPPLLKKHKYHFKNVVLGGTLSAVVHAQNTASTLIMNKAKPPLHFEDSHKDWNQGIFRLSMAGQLPFFNTITSVRIVDANTIKLTINEKFVVHAHFDQLEIFDDEGVYNIPIPKEKVDKKLVLDWIRPTSCSSHECEKIKTCDDFVNTILFYPRRCVSGKGIVSISYIKQDNLLKYDWSDTYVRFKVKKLMEEEGIKGTYNGIGASGKDNYYNINLEVEKREVKKLQMDLYDNTPTIKFNYNTVSDIILNGGAPYLRKLYEIVE